MSIKNKAMMNQIKIMLTDLKKTDEVQYDIIIQLLDLVYKEYNSGQRLNIDNKLYDMIDAEITSKIQ